MNKSQAEIIESQQSQIDLQGKRITELQKKENSIWNNTLMWTAVGITAGLLTGVLLVR